ncbi:MAG TPA: glycosyltransferase family A protein [Tepidisphaeraceae bacterium]|nr:glycosyltransferase family A protein [Tepidisphaeraceae bacterium]
MAKCTLVSVVNDETVLERNLLRSPDVVEGRFTVHVERGHRCAATAYNAGIDVCSTELVAFVHQDVYLPAGWASRLERAVDILEQGGEPWAVLGVWGVQKDGEYAGRVWCSGGNREHKSLIENAVEVTAIDEIVIVLNRSAALRFDEEMPGFHLYATDIILQAKLRGLKSYVFDGPVIHNSRPNPNPLDAAFFNAYRYMQQKWAAELPVRTCTVPITRWGWPLYKAWLRREVLRWRGKTSGGRRHDYPEELAGRLGYASSPRIHTTTSNHG